MCALQLEAAAFGGGDCQPDAYSNTSPIPLTLNQAIYNLTLCEGETDVFQTPFVNPDIYYFLLTPMNGDTLDCILPFINISFVLNNNPTTTTPSQLGGNTMSYRTSLVTGTMDVYIQANQTLACAYQIQFVIDKSA